MPSLYNFFSSYERRQKPMDHFIVVLFLLIALVFFWHLFNFVIDQDVIFCRSFSKRWLLMAYQFYTLTKRLGPPYNRRWEIVSLLANGSNILFCQCLVYTCRVNRSPNIYGMVIKWCIDHPQPSFRLGMHTTHLILVGNRMEKQEIFGPLLHQVTCLTT